MTETQEMKACPKCKGPGELCHSRDGEVSWVACSDCGAEGSLEYRDDLAVFHWNAGKLRVMTPNTSPPPPTFSQDRGEVERVRYAAIAETSTEGPRWYIWRSGEDGGYVGGSIANKTHAERIAAELNRIAAHRHDR